jgi:micrococcal nuclease
LAHLWRLDKKGAPELWVQGTLLEEGYARVYSFLDNRALAPQMIAREREARQQSLGMWADVFYEVRVPEDVDRMIDTFQVVAGKVVSTAVVRGRGYINYGDDWRDDFTASLASKVLRRFPDLKAVLSGYTGKKLQVRGWIKRYNGPMIEITHPEQIEVIEEVTKDDEDTVQVGNGEQPFEEMSPKTDMPGFDW